MRVEKIFYYQNYLNFLFVFLLYQVLDLFHLINVLYVHVVFLIHIQVHLILHVFLIKFVQYHDDVVHEYLLNMFQVFQQLDYDEHFQNYITID